MADEEAAEALRQAYLAATQAALAAAASANAIGARAITSESVAAFLSDVRRHLTLERRALAALNLYLVRAEDAEPASLLHHPRASQAELAQRIRRTERLVELLESQDA